MSCPCDCGCEQAYICHDQMCRDDGGKDQDHTIDFCHCEIRGCICTDFESSMMIAGAERALVREGRLSPPDCED